MPGPGSQFTVPALVRVPSNSTKPLMFNTPLLATVSAPLMSPPVQSIMENAPLVGMMTLPESIMT